MRWIESLHLIAIVCWFAGLFYLPRLFVYHSETNDDQGLARFIVMERKLYYFIMTPAAVITLLSGAGLVSFSPLYYFHMRWFFLKLGLVGGLFIYHGVCGKLLKDFAYNRNRLSSRAFRWFNEIPTLLLICIILLAIVQPF